MLFVPRISPNTFEGVGCLSSAESTTFSTWFSEEPRGEVALN